MSARILIVDDDTTIRTTLADALRDSGTAEITVAPSAEEAVRLLDAQGSPDLVLTDLRMRGMDGMDLLRVVRQRAPASSVVLMTAYHDVGIAVEAMREGAADFLCKPFDLAALREVVDRVLPAGSRRASESVTEAAPQAGQATNATEETGDLHAVRGSAGASRPAPGIPKSELLAGRYEIEAEVGRGAMAVVYRARDHSHDRSVAVKVLRKEVSSSIGVDRFLGEIRIAARLQHPHVLTLIDSGRWDGVPFFVMPFIAGPSLRRQLVEDGRMEIRAAAMLLRDIAGALAAAHALGIVHRDVKPENILLSGRHAWVADFGVARAISGATESGGTLTGAVMGTPLYMAPEQAYSDGAVDPRADIYALGVLGYEMLCGRAPFTGRSTRAILAAHLAEEPLPLRNRRSDVPAGLEQTVMRSLLKDPQARWPDAESLSRSFGRFALEGDR